MTETEFPKCGINKDVPLTVDDRTVISTPQEVDLQQFTEQQIEDYCKMREKECLALHPDGDWKSEDVQIIRQLQEPKEVDMEILAAAVHDAYCRYYVKTHGEQYWTNGDYKLLNEETKEIDRETVRAVLRQQAYTKLPPNQR